MKERFQCRSPRVLFTKYITDFPNIKIDWNEGWEQWTRKNLGYFATLGKDLKFVVWSQYEKDRSEYLVDLCWCVEEDQYYWMELALEEEWSDREQNIYDDFYKLIDVKAHNKVFICFPKEDIRPELPSHLASRVSAHGIKIPEEAYLLIIFSRDRRRKQSERLEIEGFAIDYRGNLEELGSKHFADSLV